MGAVMTRLAGSPTSLITAALMLLAGTIAAVPATAQAGPAAPPAPAPDQRVRLHAAPGDVVRSATVDLADRSWSRSRGTAKTLTLRTGRFSMVGATWRGATPRLEVRTRHASGWTTWRHADPMTDGGDPIAGGRGASELLWVDDSKGIQVRAEGGVPGDLDLVLIDPGHLPGDRRSPAGQQASPTARSKAPTSAPMPKLRTRRQWGANNSWRNGSPRFNTYLQQVHVHHTATGNTYSRSDVPRILRGMYRYHTKSLGWFDIGYNFVVDKFGRAWVGRSGGSNRLVRGAHTLGFNKTSVGIAVVGNLEDRRPWPKAVTTVVKLAAWKLDRYDRQADGDVVVRSSGSDKYAEDERVELPIIDGHRDTNDTACPGEYLYAELPRIRTRAQWRVDHW